MINEYIILGYYLMWGVLVFTSVSFLISGLDDLFFDIVYWSYMIWRRWVLRKSKELVYDKIVDLPQQRIAVMIACWHEAGVIEVMLKYNVYSIDYQHYDLFVGVYPNDPNTVAAVQQIERTMPHVRCVIAPTPGPTNKASNLNSIYAHILQYEKQNNVRYSIFVMHDSEDIIHPLSFKLYNYLIPKNAMVQVPIFPLELNLNEYIHWIYAAEFSEAHTKDMVVREAIGGLVPSAGVGTGFSRPALEYLTKVCDGVPFATNTLTEDYSTALQIRLHGMREIFVTQYVYRTIWRRRWIFFGAFKPYIVKDYIATRAMFPKEYMKSVRQKSRWLLGIAFEEWINTGWKGNVATIYTLIHDRKSLFTHLITGLFFLLIPFWLFYAYFTSGRPDYPTLQDQFEQYPWVWHVIVISSYLMLVRIIERAIAVYRIYSFLPALFSVPLILYGNIINLHALLRAYSQFLFSPKTQSGNNKWDKTDHEFPVQRLLIDYKLKLGDLLIENKFLTEAQLNEALKEQNSTGEQLGALLVRLHYITHEQLMRVLSYQYNLPLISKQNVVPLKFTKIAGISHFTYDRLLRAKCIPIDVRAGVMTIAIEDPSNEILLAAVIEWIKPYTPKFCVMDQTVTG
jgi:adsorption protein B